MLKIDLHSAIKSEDSEALDSGTSQLSSAGQPEGVWWNRNVLRRFLKTVINDVGCKCPTVWLPLIESNSVTSLHPKTSWPRLGRGDHKLIFAVLTVS